MTKPEVQIDIKPAGMESAIVYAPFDDALEALTEKGYELISLPQNAKLRIQQGSSSYISQNSNVTREMFVYVPKKGAFLTRNSLIMENAKEATQDHREGGDYFLTDEQVEQALIDSLKIEGEEIEIPTNEFGKNEITNYTFGEVAEQYGQFLKEFGIKKMPIWLASLKDKPFARQMWFRSLLDGSVLFGDGMDLHDGLRLRGVKDGFGMQNLQGTVGYTSEQISNVLKDLGIGGLETQVLSKLKRQV